MKTFYTVRIMRFAFALSAISLAVFPNNAFSFQYNGIELKVNGRITEQYDDNINFTKANKETDLMTYLNVGLNVAYGGKRRAIYLSGQATKSLKTKSSNIKNSSENVRIIYQEEISKYDTLGLNYNYYHSQVPANVEEEFGRIRGRSDSFSHRTGINYAREVSEDLTLGASYSIGKEKTQWDIERMSTSNSLGFKVNYIYSIATSLVFSCNLENTNIEGSGDIKSQGFSAGLIKYLTKNIHFNGNGGLTRTTSLDNTTHTDKSVFLSLVDDISVDSNASISFSKNDQVGSDTGDIFSNWQVSAFYNKQFLKKLSGLVSFFYGEGKYISSDIKDELFGVNSSLTYEFNDHLSGSVTYNFTDLESTDEFRGYSRNTLAIGISTVF